MELNRILIVSTVSLSISLFSAHALAEETAQETRARELCTETAADGAYPRWSVKNGETCNNSFIEACTIVRNKDGLEVKHQCSPPPENSDSDDDSGGGSSSSPRPQQRE